MTVGRSYYELIPQALTGSETSGKSCKLKLSPTRKSGAVVTVPNPTAVGTPDNADSVFVQVSGTHEIEVRLSAGGPASEHSIQVMVLSGSIERRISDTDGAVLMRSGAGLTFRVAGLKLYAGDLVYVVLNHTGSGTMPAPTQGSVVFVCWSRAPLNALAKTSNLVASTDRVNVGDNDSSAGFTTYTGATLTGTTAATQTGTTNFGSSRAGLLEWITPWEVTGSGTTSHALRLYPTGTTDADPRPVCWVQDCMSTGTNSLTNTAGCESPTTARLVTTCYGESNGTVPDPLTGVDAISVLQMWRHRILVRAGNEIDASRLWAASGAARAGSQSVRVRAGMHVAYRSVLTGGVVGTPVSTPGSNDNWVGADLAIVNGGTGASTAAAAATNLGLGTGNTPQFTGLLVNTSSFSAAGIVAEMRGNVNTLPILKIKTTGALSAARGIGVEFADNPSATGDFFIYFEDAGGTRGSISGDGGTGIDVNLTSDERHKDSIRDAEIGGARDAIRQIRERDWEPLAKDHPRARRGRGFIAQELYAAYPDAVRPAHTAERAVFAEGPDGKPVQVGVETYEVPWQVAPMRLIPLLTRVAREQDAAIVALEARLAALEARLAALEGR